jgi:DNA-binding transcriptional MerR regulator
LDKAPDAFRTISEVADDLDVPQHVLRFWETRFAQIKPMKRSGGRRYYRPDDVNLLRGIRRLLYGEGYTIRGVQRILREHGVKAVQALPEAGTDHVPLFEAPSLDAARGARRDRDSRHADTGPAEIDADTDEDFAADEDVDADTDGDVDVDVDMTSPLSLRDPGPLLPNPGPRPSPPPKPVVQKPLVAVAPHGPSGAEAYAPPSVRNSARSADRGKLQAVLDDLIGARALIDKVLRDD